MPQLRLALAQVNARVGDLHGNAEIVVEQAHAAADAGAHLLVLPEMVITGYPIEDLAYRRSFIEASQQTVKDLAVRLDAEGLGDLVVVLGHLDSAKAMTLAAIPERLGVPKNEPTNSASVITGGEVVARYDKHHLPNYGVFDEFRHFVPGDETQVIQVHGVDVAIAICEDIWQDGPSAAADAAEAGLLVVLNGSPYEAAKDDTRLTLCSRRAVSRGFAAT
ncbi:MAG: NAD+ synthase, partial [Actinomycetales bacterium]